MKTKIEIGTQVKGTNGTGVISKIITKSTGYVEVTYNDGTIKREMAFNLRDMGGVSLKSIPSRKPESENMKDVRHAVFMRNLRSALVEEHGRPDLSTDTLMKMSIVY